MLDEGGFGSYVALGAAVENITIAASVAGLACDIQLSAEDVRVELSESKLYPSPFASRVAPFITRRVTNRKLGKRILCKPGDLELLQDVAAGDGSRLQIVTDERQLDTIGEILGAGDRVRFLSKRLHAEMMSEVRWTPEETDTTRDGLDLPTLELSRADLAGTRLARDWNNILFLREIQGGKALEKSAKDAVRAASAMCLLTVPLRRQENALESAFFQGGRALQRVWLSATSLGLSVQPMTALLYLWRGKAAGLDHEEVATLCDLRERWNTVFRENEEVAEVMLFRVSMSDAPTARSLRRHVENVFMNTTRKVAP